MLFTSPLFLFVFLPLFFALYFLSPKKFRNYVALLASCAFYMWGEPKFIFIVLISLIIDWLLGNLIYENREKRSLQKVYLILAIVLDVGVLVYFKYANFFVDNLNALLAPFHMDSIVWTRILLPIGVSFFTFEKITYVVDIYKSVGKPAQKLSTYALYILLFPKFLAGPIVKYHDIADQLENRKTDIEGVCYGIYRFSLGLAKKVLIADSLSAVADGIFKLPVSSLDFSTAWLGIVCFTFQIYFDFSAYSDMAIALARIMGFKLMENFTMPYISSNFTEFWRRWHISLSTWIKNYLYIPLGGNRCSKLRNYFNLWFSFLISGLWHGANWNFVIWGLYHGFFLVLDKIFWIDKSKKVPKLIKVALTFFLVMIGWVFFRINSLGQAFGYLGKLFGINGSVAAQSVAASPSLIFILVLSFFLCFIPVTGFYWGMAEKFKQKVFTNYGVIARMAVTVIFFILSFAKIAVSEFNPFLYFRF